MGFWKDKRSSRRARLPTTDARLRVLHVFVFAAMLAVVCRLFILQVLSHGFYAALASDQHGIFEKLFPERGIIYVRDPKAPDGRFPAAINKNLYLVYANAREIADPGAAAIALAGPLALEEQVLFQKLSNKDDPYEPLKRKVDDDTVRAVKALGIHGIGFAREQYRFYPEHAALSHVLGFVGSNESGERVGRYGVEGHWNGELAGQSGFLEAERDPIGRWIGTAERSFRPASDGEDITLTIDRNIQYVVCEKLKAAVARHGADGGTVVIMDPKTGAVIAMCGAPDYDPNDFSNVADISHFNNPAIFSAYEPGSIFKPLTMVAAIDAGAVTPNTLYEDTGNVVIGSYTIRNSDGKAHGMRSMTQVLEDSLNTGTIFAVRKLGPKKFLSYVEGFGFGSPTGIELDTEASGDIDSLRKKGEIWSATASFGQGITTTPLQLVSAYAALANGGKVMQPRIIASIAKADGTTMTVEPKVARQVITKRAAALVGGMLVRVVEYGHGKKAAVPGYYVAGKTGTAQIAKAGGGYEAEAHVGSFIGYAPVDDPAFVMLVRIDRPRDVQWAESSAAPLFGEIAGFLLQYMQIPPERLLK